MSGKRRPNLLPPINQSAKNPSPCIGVDDKGNNNSNKRTVLPMTFDLFATAVRANTLPTALHKGAGMVHPPSGCVGCSNGFRCKIILYPMMTIIIKFSISNIDQANRFHTYSAGRLGKWGMAGGKPERLASNSVDSCQKSGVGHHTWPAR